MTDQQQLIANLSSWTVRLEAIEASAGVYRENVTATLATLGRLGSTDPQRAVILAEIPAVLAALEAQFGNVRVYSPA
jgi:hypothetical protein